LIGNLEKGRKSQRAPSEQTEWPHKFFNYNNMDVKLQPLGKRVLVKPIEKEEKTKGGLYIPDTAGDDQKPQQGTIVKLGLYKKDYEFPVKVGDMVFIKKYSTEDVEIDGEKYILVDVTDILGVLK